MDALWRFVADLPWISILGAILGLVAVTLLQPTPQKLPGHRLNSFTWEGPSKLIPEAKRAEYFEARRLMHHGKEKEVSDAFHAVCELERPYYDHQRELINKAALPRDEVKAFVEKHSRVIGESRIQEVKRTYGIPYADGAKPFVKATGNSDPDFFYPVDYDQEFGASCSQYAFYLMRGENPGEFIDPLGAWEPIGLMLAQGYEPVNPDEAQENDVVVYFMYNPDSPNGKVIKEEMRDGEKWTVESSDYMVQCSHFGVIRKGKVTSKDLWGYIAHHSIEAGGVPGWRYFVVRKPMPTERKVPVVDGFDDWYETELCVTRENYAYPIRSELNPWYRFGAALLGAFLTSSVMSVVGRK